MSDSEPPNTRPIYDPEQAPDWIELEREKYSGCDFILAETFGGFRGAVRMYYPDNGKLEGAVYSARLESKEAVRDWLNEQKEYVLRAQARSKQSL